MLSYITSTPHSHDHLILFTSNYPSSRCTYPFLQYTFALISISTYLFYPSYTLTFTSMPYLIFPSLHLCRVRSVWRKSTGLRRPRPSSSACSKTPGKNSHSVTWVTRARSSTLWKTDSCCASHIYMGTVLTVINSFMVSLVQGDDCPHNIIQCLILFDLTLSCHITSCHVTYVCRYGSWDMVRNSIRRCDRFRFDFYLQSCSAEALGKRYARTLHTTLLTSFPFHHALPNFYFYLIRYPPCFSLLFHPPPSIHSFSASNQTSSLYSTPIISAASPSLSLLSLSLFLNRD